MNVANKIANSDPRYYQIAVLGTFLLYGLLGLQFEISWLQAFISLSSVCLFQYIFSKIVGAPRVEYKSALISGISLTLLLRTTSMWVALLAAAVSIGSKFLIRANGKHVFNPTNLGIVFVILLTGEAWISPGQWGSAAYFALIAAFLGVCVVNRASRSDVAASFLIFYTALLFYRAGQLGDPLTIPLHQLLSGSLIIFTFHMISDPMTAPENKTIRVIYGMVVAYLAYYFRFTLFEPNSLIYALVILAPVVPIINWIFPGKKYYWERPQSVACSA